MKKKVVIFYIFLSFFFIKPAPIHAATGFEMLWDWITNSLDRLLGANIAHITNNENPSVLDQTKTLTDYRAKNQDEANRITPNALKAYYKGVWFYEVLTTSRFGKDKKTQTLTIDDKTACSNDININDIVCFYYQNGEKILYQRGNKEPEENPTGTECRALNNPDICYQNLYINYQDIPQGFFEGLEEVAPAVSTQLNDTIRYTLPKTGQGQTAPDNNETAEKAEIIALDTDKQEMFKLVGFIPKTGHSKIPCVSNDTNFTSADLNNVTANSTNRSNRQNSVVLGVSSDKDTKDKNREFLRKSFQQWLLPKSWQKDEDQVNSIDLTDVKPHINCPEEELREAGYSEFGALGMAMTGIKYQEILDRYFDTKEDDKYSVKKRPNFSTKDYKVQVELLEKWKREDNIDTPEDSKEKYQNCITLADDETLEGEIDYEIINITESKTYQKNPTSSSGKAKLGYDGEIPDPNYNCKNNWPGTEEDFDNKSTEEQIKWAQNNKSDFDPENDNPKDVWNEIKDTWNISCTYRVTMSVDDYLMGIAEIFNGWHVEAHKSLIVACRNNLFREEINDKIITTPNCIQQAFRCKSLHTNKTALKNNIFTNSATAVAATDNQFLVDNKDGTTIIHGNIFNKLCQQQKHYPFYDGTYYEAIGLKVVNDGTLNTYSGTCYLELNPDDPVSAFGVDDNDF